MNSETPKRKFWQIAAGDSGRSYADVFLQYAVALIGPGDPGPWQDGQSNYNFDKRGFVRRFATAVRSGDGIVLREGRSTVRAFGIVAHAYDHLPQFEDVNGWDLQHALRVHWHNLSKPYDFGDPVFGTSPTRLSRVHQEDVLALANRTLNTLPPRWNCTQLPELPPQSEEVSVATLPHELRTTINDMRELATGYWGERIDTEWPQEAEVVAHLVVPFLRALGWSTENIAVGWRRTDVCVFSELPRRPETCQIVIEAKRLGTAIESAQEQARGYVSSLGTSSDVVLTDGLRYRLYAAERGYEQIAYANVTRLKGDAAELFSRMSPT